MFDSGARLAIPLGWLLALIAATIFVGLPAASGQSCPDFWWHLLLADEIVARRALHFPDTLSFAPEGAPYLLTQWLGELVVVWLPFKMFGLIGTALLASVLGLAVIVVLWRTARLHLEAGPAWVVALALGAPFLSLYARPQVLSFVLCAVLQLLLERARAQGWRSRSAWPVAAVMALWANVHGSYPVGLLLLGLHLVCPLLARALTSPATHPSSAVFAPWRVGGFLLLGLVATLLNPWGVESWLRVVEISRYQTTTSGVISEWMPTSFGSALGSTFLLCVLGTLLLMAASRARPSLEDLLTTFLVVIFGLLAARQSYYALIALVPIAARAASGAAFLAPVSRLTSRRVHPLVVGLVLAGAAALHLVQHKSQTVALERYARQVFPVQAAAFIQHSGLRGKVFNETTAGGWLAYHLRMPVYIDGRLDLHGDRKFFEWFFARNGVPGWEDVVSRSGADLAVLQTQSPLVQLLMTSGDWTLVHSDAAYSVLVLDSVHVAFAQTHRQTAIARPAIFDAGGKLALPPLGY